MKIIDTTIGNVLGLQVTRAIGARTVLNRRRKRCPERQLPEVQGLIDEGCCIILDFLSTLAFEAVLSEFKAAMDDLERRPNNDNHTTQVAYGAVLRQKYNEQISQ